MGKMWFVLLAVANYILYVFFNIISNTSFILAKWNRVWHEFTCVFIKHTMSCAQTKEGNIDSSNRVIVPRNKTEFVTINNAWFDQQAFYIEKRVFFARWTRRSTSLITFYTNMTRFPYYIFLGSGWFEIWNSRYDAIDNKFDICYFIWSRQLGYLLAIYVLYITWYGYLTLDGVLYYSRCILEHISFFHFYFLWFCPSPGSAENIVKKKILIDRIDHV